MAGQRQLAVADAPHHLEPAELLRTPGSIVSVSKA
jgi:hypothetical protein